MKCFSAYILQFTEGSYNLKEGTASDLPNLSGVHVTKVPIHPSSASKYTLPYFRVVGMNYDICWYLSQPTPEHLKFMATPYFAATVVPNTSSSDWNDTPWKMRDNHSYTDGIVYKVPPEVQALKDWFNHDTNKIDLAVEALRKIASCPNRASWAATPTMKGYRGLRKELADIKNYSFTGEVFKPTQHGGRILFAVAKGMYKSKMPIQSWSENFIVAHNFGVTSNTMIDGEVYPRSGSIAVIQSATIDTKEIGLTPTISRALSKWRSEDEIIRVSNKPLPVTIYVSVEDVKKTMKHNSENINDARRFAREVFGVSAGDRLMNIPEFRKVVMS